MATLLKESVELYEAPRTSPKTSEDKRVPRGALGDMMREAQRVQDVRPKSQKSEQPTEDQNDARRVEELKADIIRTEKTLTRRKKDVAELRHMLSTLAYSL